MMCVQGYYVNTGFLLASYHKFYWIGLNSSAAVWPRFTWTVRMHLVLGTLTCTLQHPAT